MTQWLKVGLVAVAIAGVVASFYVGAFVFPRTVYVDRPVSQNVIFNATIAVPARSVTIAEPVVTLRLSPSSPVRVDLTVLSNGTVAFDIWNIATTQDVYFASSTGGVGIDLTVPEAQVYVFEVVNNEDFEQPVWLRVLPK